MNFVSVPLLVTALIGGTAVSAFAQCMTFDSSHYPVFQSLYYVSAPNVTGDRLVVGAFNSVADFQRLANIPTPYSPNQQICGTVYIAPGVRAQAYVPTASERAGNFSPFAGELLDPTTGTPNPVFGGIPIGAMPFVAGIIPAARMGTLWAWRVSSVQYIPNATNTVTITTPSSLPAPVAGSPYSRQLSATGGRQPYTWSVTKGTLPLGLSLNADQGTVSGTLEEAITPPAAVTIQVTDASSATSTLEFTFGLELMGIPARVGVFSQVAVGAGWKTTIYLSNTSAVSALTRVSFRKDDGSSLDMPLTVWASGSMTWGNVAGAEEVIEPNSIMVIEAESDSATSLTGWAEVDSVSPLSGYAVFRSTSGSGVSSEGTVPLETSYQSSFALIYDNTNGQSTALAIANLGSGSPPVQLTAYDPNGIQVDATTTGWPAGNGYGHRSFMLTDLLPKAAGNRGILVVSAAATSQITGLGLRVSSTGSFSAIPKQAAPGQ
jgi:hypothetical protein